MKEPDLKIRTYFARGRNALVARADCSELFAAWYLHRMDLGINLPPAGDELGRNALAGMALHCASRPRNEACAWTVHFAAARVNLFAAGDNRLGTVVVNVFTDDVKEIPSSLFYADVVEGDRPPRRSVIEFDDATFLGALETFYRQSEQRMARFFWHDEEDLVMISAQPDCDLDWLAGLDREQVLTLDSHVELALLEERCMRFECGCNQSRILDVLAPVFRRQGEEIFGDEQTIRVHCPRCGARYMITREALEAHVA